MLEEVTKLLKAMGVTVSDGDPLLAFICDSVTEQLKNETNQEELPEGLRFLAVELAVGKFLRCKLNAGQLEGFDLDAAVKSIQEGDTNVTFAIGDGSATPEARLNALISYLENGRLREVIRYRRLVW